MVFAAEGCPSGHIPAHYQMSEMHGISPGGCISAGNAFFDESNKLCVIDHKSGDYRPPFDSLQFALKAFSKAHVPMESKIIVRRLDCTGCFVQNYSINSEDILEPTPVAALVTAAVHAAEPSNTADKSDQAVTMVTSHQDKLARYGLLGTTILQQIKRLESGAMSCNPYWINSSKKLKAIIDSLNKLPPNIPEAQLKVIVKDPGTELYKALNIQRLSSITFFGKLGWNYAKSLQAVHTVAPNQIMT